MMNTRGMSDHEVSATEYSFKNSTHRHPSIYPCIHAYINITVSIQKNINLSSKVTNADIKITEESKLEACRSWEKVEGEEEGREVVKNILLNINNKTDERRTQPYTNENMVKSCTYLSELTKS